MYKKPLGIVFIAIMLFGVFVLAGCVTDIDGNYNGFSSGFNYVISHEYSTIDCAARSEKTEFNINDVTLDFYVGWRKDNPIDADELAQSESSIIALYFAVPLTDYPKRYYDEIDYRNIAGLYCISNIPAQTFFSDNYAIEITKKTGKVFGESAKFTVPKEIFEKQNDSFNFLVFFVTFSENEKTYKGHVLALMNIKCMYIDDNTISLERSYHK